MFRSESNDDLRAMFQDGPYTLTANGVTQPCDFQDTDELAFKDGNGPEQIIQAAVVTIVTDDFPNIKGGDLCSVTTLNQDGSVASSKNFKVWRRLRVQDGAATELVMRVG